MLNLVKKHNLFPGDLTGSPDNYFSINKECTEQIKGLAILAVLIAHYSVVMDIKSSLLYFGAQGVAIFLILSGYGLTLSYNKTKNKNFFSKRFSKVFVPYFIVTLGWIIMNTMYFHITYAKRTIFFALIGFDIHRSIDGTMWYISFVILWYFIFYFTFKLNINKIFKLLILFCFAYWFRKNTFYTIFHINFGDLAWQYGLHAYFFPIGVLIAFYFDKISAYLTPVRLFIFSTVCFLIYVINIHNNTIDLSYYTVSNLFFALGVISFLCLLSYFNVYSRLLKFLGKYSYEIYLLEGNLLAITHLFKNKLLALPFYLTVLIPLTLVLSKIIKIDFSPIKAKLSI